MKAIIFTEVGNDIGLGHISRCSSLYDEVARRGIEVELIIHGNIENMNFFQGIMVKNINWLSEEYLNNYIKITDYCIVDSYLASENKYQIISNKSKKSLFIDDNVRIEYPKGIIVNPSLTVNDLSYPMNDDKIYLLGANYIILRSPFINVIRSNINKYVRAVLITMGGSDLRDLTPKIINKICTEYPDIKFDVVIGNTFHSINLIESIKPKNVELHYNIEAELMKNLMLKSDFAITAAGQTIYELCATQTPFIPIQIIDNQRNNIQGLRKINPHQVVIEHDCECFIEELEKEFILMLNLDKRKALVNSYLTSVDGFGSKRIIDKLLSD